MSEYKYVETFLPKLCRELSKSSLIRCDLRNTEFTQVSFSSFVFSDCLINNTTIFNACNLTEVNLDDKNMRATVLKNSILASGSFVNTNFRACNLQGCNLAGCRFQKCNLNHQSFHAKCDSHAPTLTIIKTSGHDPQIFGGYTTQTWNPVNDNYKRDSESFIFKYHDSKCMFEILPNSDPSTGEAVYATPNNLTCFGGGCDISIADKCNENKKSYCNLGYSYTIPQSLSNFQHEDAEVRSYLAGSKNFKVSEIEVYKVN